MIRVDEPDLTPALVRQRVDSLLGRLRAAAENAGRDPQGFRLVAVTKGFGLSVVRTAVDAGLTTLGENRVQEAAPKVEAFPRVDWHLVGRLQSNKARHAIRLFGSIHSVDSLDLLERLDRIAREEGRTPSLLLQVNVAGEAQKAGFDAGWFREASGAGAPLAAAVRGLSAVTVTGLMTMAPLGAEPRAQHAVFAGLRRLRDRLQDGAGVPLPHLSMGMTADAEAAVAEGATVIRVGTAIFGPRPHH